MVDDVFFASAPPEHVAREKAKARELRKTGWWKRRVAAGVCHYCGRRVPPSELTMDHVVPLARGGRSVRSNVVPACKDCNSKKRYLLPVEWAEYLERLRGGGPGDEA
ncbi:HNH endonuclease [Deferrisoma palaeochoriense]